MPVLARVSRITRYPVKACAPELLDEAVLGAAGLAHDRELAVVEGDRVLTQREAPALALVQPRLDDASGELQLSWRGTDAPAPVTGVVSTTGPRRDVLLFGKPAAVVDQDPALGDWLGRLLGRDVRLVAAPGSTRRTSPGEVEGLTVLADEGTVSLHSEASLAELGDRLLDAGSEPLGPDRFRANLVVTGCPPHAEDEARRLEVGPVVLRFAQQDARCAVTMVDQDRGEKDGPEPIRTLSTYRRSVDGDVVFGVFLAVETGGVVRVGDPVSMT